VYCKNNFSLLSGECTVSQTARFHHPQDRKYLPATVYSVACFLLHLQLLKELLRLRTDSFKYGDGLL
jgi:hypothetical protein